MMAHPRVLKMPTLFSFRFRGTSGKNLFYSYAEKAKSLFNGSSGWKKPSLYDGKE
jgi:hypothetical protein